MGRTVVIDGAARRADIVGAFESAGRELRNAASMWGEAELDRRAMTHPLAGLMTVREMLLVVHERHHMNRLGPAGWIASKASRGSYADRPGR